MAVALRKESVDRNEQADRNEAADGVALRKESVDRNGIGRAAVPFEGESLSARRAWIEIGVTAQKNNRLTGRSPQGERG